MVETLLSQRGAAQDSRLFAFTSDITSDQSMEIDRMDAMLAELSPDPLVKLAAGFHDAGQASWNMALVATRPKPEGFYDPHTPAGRPHSEGSVVSSDLTPIFSDGPVHEGPDRDGQDSFSVIVFSTRKSGLAYLWI